MGISVPLKGEMSTNCPSTTKAMFTLIRSGCQEVTEEPIVHKRPSTQARESTLTLKARADVTKSPKEGYQ